MSYLNGEEFQELGVQVDGTFARQSAAASFSSLSINGNIITISSVDGTASQSIDIGPAILAMIESHRQDLSGYLTQATADGKYGRYISYASGTKVLTLSNANGGQLDTTTIV